MNADETSLSEEVSSALLSDVDPSRLDSFRFAAGILPVFKLIRALFSQNELDTCLKLMVLHELSRSSGRFSLERIRSHAAFLEPGRVDSIVRSLREGEWLDLRAVDNTYTLSPVGLTLVALLHAADLGGLSPTNMLARAAQNAAFGAELDGSEGMIGYLLDQLLVLLEDQAEEATAVLRQGRPFRMIAWNRRNHRRQLTIIRQVLGSLTEHMDESSREFGKVVRLHEAMQQVFKQLSGIHDRLTEWNLGKLHTSETGYSISELSEVVIGIESDQDLLCMVSKGVLFVPDLPPTLTTAEIRERFEGARRRLPSQKEVFLYRAPEPPVFKDRPAANLDPAASLRAKLTELLAGRTAADQPLELDEWLENPAFAGAAYQMGVLSRLQLDGDLIRLEDGRAAELRMTLSTGREIKPSQLLSYMETEGALRSLPAGRFSRVTLGIANAPRSEKNG